jgi:hypothetical protein
MQHLHKTAHAGPSISHGLAQNTKPVLIAGRDDVGFQGRLDDRKVVINVLNL